MGNSGLVIIIIISCALEEGLNGVVAFTVIG